MNDSSACTASVRPVDEDFFEFRRTGSRALRNALIERHLGIAHHLARRYRHRGVADDDRLRSAVPDVIKLWGHNGPGGFRARERIPADFRVAARSGRLNVIEPAGIQRVALFIGHI